MSLPPELRALCFQLSNTPTSDLPRLTPTLLRYVSRCEAALSSPAGNTSKADSSASSAQVQVHKLKTQLSTLLNGKSPEGRFAAVVLIKAVVEVGGWEVLRSSEQWVRGMLSILVKPDSPATKELCIIALTKIYCMTHSYQTLVREITTPTLPTFITSCLNMISSKSSARAQDVPVSTAEAVFRSFATLLPRHTTIYRPFVSQIRSMAKRYVAATLSDGMFVPSSLAKSARRLVVLLHLTVAKNAGGEEWGKALRDLIKEIHATADGVFRAVIEDWESAVGYIGEPVDVGAELCGGSRNLDDLSRWTGIEAGVERMIGLLRLLAEYFKNDTSMPVSIPLGAIIDMITRIISIAVPPSSKSPTSQKSSRLHPAIDSDEKAALWAGMPQIYVAALKIVSTIADRLQECFLPMAQGFLDQLAWVFPYGKHDTEFRVDAYHLIGQLLLQTGKSLGKSSSTKCSTILRSCCNDIIPVSTKNFNGAGAGGKKSNGNMLNSNQNADTFLQNSVDTPQNISLNTSELELAAKDLLPLFLSHFPQQHLDISLRSLIERTAILSHNQQAMLSSILNPYVGKNGKAIASILPHLTREFPSEETTEILLRPRMPLVPSTGVRMLLEEGGVTQDEDENEDEDMQMGEDNVDSVGAPVDHNSAFDTDGRHLQRNTGVKDIADNHPGLGNSELLASELTPAQQSFGNLPLSASTSLPSNFVIPADHQQMSSRSDDPMTQLHQEFREKIPGASIENNMDDDSDESVHLTMQLDTDSESDG